MKKATTILKGATGIILTSLGIILFIVLLVNIIKAQTNSSVDRNDSMSITEAQTKCMLMEEADLINLMGETFGDATTKKAEQFCLSQWDMTKNPENTEEKFKEIVKIDWESRKYETLEGYTLEEYYNEATK